MCDIYMSVSSTVNELKLKKSTLFFFRADKTDMTLW